MLGSLISAGAGLIGGLLGNKANAKANDQNAALQKEAAQNQVQWRVADANKAGVSPLVALGMSPISMSPSYVGDTSLPASMANMGQDIGRAVSAKMGPQERVNATLGALQIERAQLENDVLRQQLRSHSAAGTPPGIAGATVVPGAGDAPVIEITPPTRTPYVTRGDGSFMKTSPMMDAQVAENRYGDALQEAFGLRAFLEDFFPAQINWFDSQVYDGRSYRDLTEGRR